MKRIIAVFALAILAALSSACSTLADAQAAKGTGTSKIYNKPYDAVWNAVVETVRASGLALVSDNRERGTILAQGSVSAFSWGENVVIYVEDAGGRTRTRVEVINKRAVATNITAANWEARLFEALDKRL